MRNIYGVIISYIYILLVLGLVSLYAKKQKGDPEIPRKLIHILVGNWVFLTPIFTAWWALAIVPLNSLLVNTLNRKYRFIPAMERQDDGFGTIYYAISMLILTSAAFFLKWPTLSFVGLLIMVYGDGLAAIVGKRWGKRRPFPFAPEKTLLGSAVVTGLAFVITLVCLLVFQGQGALRAADTPTVLLIALFTAALSGFIELTGKEGCDNLSLPVGAGLFATLCLQFGETGLYVFLLMCLVILWLALRWQVITATGAVAALLSGQTLYALGGAWLGASLLAFFLIGSVASKLKNNQKKAAEALQVPGSARSWKQVLSNSLPAGVLVWLAYGLGDHRLILPAFAVFAAAAADTLSSEYGMLSNGQVFSIINGKPLPRGLSGGVTWIGLMAGIMGSGMLSLFALPQFGIKGFILCGLLGFVGTLIDSLLGALLQAKYEGPDGRIQEVPVHEGDPVLSGFPLVTNSAVNLITLSVVAALGVLLL